MQDYESEVEDYTIATQANDESDASLMSIDLEPIELKTEEKVWLSSSKNVLLH